MKLDELPLPIPSWYAIETPGADVDVTFVTTKGEALEYCESGSGFDEQAAPLFSADQMRAAMRAGALAALDEAAKVCLVPFACSHPNCGAGCNEECGGCQADLANDRWQQRSVGEAQECANAIRRLRDTIAKGESE